MLLATRQLAASALRPTLSQPCRYIGQCEATHLGCRKFAEIGSQPRAAAAMTPFENGVVTVTRIGGWALCKGLTLTPPPPPPAPLRPAPPRPHFPLPLSHPPP